MGADLRDHVHPPLDAERTLGALVSLAPSRISREFRLTGPSITISAGALSGIAALQAAVDALERGEVELAIAGAVEADEANGQEVFLKLEEQHAGTFHYKEYKSLRYLMRRSFTSDFDF